LELPDLEFNWSVNEAQFQSYAILDQILHSLNNQPILVGK